MITQILESAQQLASLGYAVFPCAPGQKRPATPNGLLDASADAEIVEQLFASLPANCNLALRTDGLLVIDVDGNDNQWLMDEPDKLLELAAGPLSLTPRGGRHFIFRQPDGMRFRNTAGKLAPKVDTRADGGYILVPPSVVEGKPYQWGNPLDCEPEKLPTPPEWLLRLLTTETQRHGEGNLKNSSPCLSASVVTAGNAIPDGQRNGTLTRLAGTMRRSGMSESELLAALLKVNSERCKPPLDEGEVRVIAASVGRYEPDQLAVAIAEDHAGQDGLLPVVTAKVGPLPDELLSVPGFVGEVVRWNLDGAYKRQPILALAGALSLLSVLTGRKIADPYGTRTNLYCLAVGESGCGKERARVVNRAILFRAGLQHLFADGIASGSGLASAMQQQPALLFQTDEIGRVLQTLGNPRQSPYLYQIATVLMKLFTSAGEIYKGDVYADAKKNVVINQPHAVLYGTTVPKSLYEGLTADSISDGFMSRMLIFETLDDPEAQSPAQSAPPEELVTAAKWWSDFKPGGNLASEHPVPAIIDYTQEAIERLAELEQLARDERKRDARFGSLWTRTTEKARKLALLWACSENRARPIVGDLGANWGWRLSEHLTRRMIEIAAEHVSENSVEANRKRVLRIIREVGDRGITSSELARRLQWLKARERHEILDVLLEAGEVRLETVVTTGRPRSVYIAC